jgi:hypothetical protein
MHICALGDIATYSIQRCPSLSLRLVPLPQLLAPTVDHAHVDDELITNNGATAISCGELDPFDLRRQLATFSHGDLLSLRSVEGSRCRLSVGSDETLDLCGRHPARSADLDPSKLAGVEETIDGRTRDAQHLSRFHDSSR